jgi:hypothetical protein
MTFAILIALLTALAVAADIFDVTKTVQGIKLGVGIEANELITTIARTDKPSAAVLYAINLFAIAAYTLAGFIGLFVTLPGFVGVGLVAGSIVILPIAAVKHIQGGREWIWMMKNPMKKLPQPSTIWQKFVGVWV